MKYGVISDLHNHAHSLFATVDPDGVNSRLRITLNETERAAEAVLAVGGHVLVVAGDIFHTRGVMDPEVLNPVRASFARITDMGIDVLMVPGNHDLKSRNTTELSSAIQNLEQVGLVAGSVRVFNAPTTYNKGDTHLLMLPWRETNEEVIADLTAFSTTKIDPTQFDVFVHRGIDGVLNGTPDTGFSASLLAKFGFRRVFAGHYHNHMDFGNGVFSVGATAHHNWGDIGTRAGFLIVDTDPAAGWKGVTFNDTLAPKFVDISGKDEMEMELEARGNYVRFRGPQMTQEQITELRDQLRKWGARGVSIEVPRVAVTARSAAPAKGLTIKQSIDAFVTASTLPAHVTKEEVIEKAQAIFDLSVSVLDEA